MMKTLLAIVCILAVTQCQMTIPPPDNATATLLLNLHNAERLAVGLGNLTWNTTLAQQAQTWANYLATNGKFYHSGTGWVGENLAYSSYTPNMAQTLFRQWSSEKQYFNPTARYGSANISNPPGYVVSHYTQIIWSFTYTVGCGLSNSSGLYYLVCQYVYPGNFDGNYVYTPSDTNPWIAKQPIPNAAALPPAPPQNWYPTVLPDSMIQQILDLHNIERMFVGMKNLTWNASIAADAQSNANYNAQQGTLYLSGKRGENIKSITISFNAIAVMIGTWSSERQYFDATKPYPRCAINNYMVSHYTQMVWSASYQIGCGFATNNYNAVLDCQYTLSGNYIGNYVVYPPPATNFNFTVRGSATANV